MLPDGFVYVVKEEGARSTAGIPYYFGYSHSRDAHRDLANLQTGNPRRLTLVAVVPGTRALVTNVGRQLNPMKVRGGWFHLTPAAAAKIIQGLRVSM